MLKYSKIIGLVLFSSLFGMCSKKSESKPEIDTMLEGTTTVLVDETLKPIIEDQVQIFESRYDAKINIIAKSEAEVIQSLVNDSSRIAILSRTLTSEELKFFDKKKITPKVRLFAQDAIALISNKNNKDTLIAFQDVSEVMQKNTQSKIRGVVC